MKILKYFKKFFPKFFVGIWLNHGRYHITTRKILSSGKINYDSFSFDKDVELDEMFKFLNKIQSQHFLTYIAVLDTGEFQGALPTVHFTDFPDFPEIKQYNDFDDILFKNHHLGWSVFSTISEMLHIQNIFKNVGVDFIFSPFLIPIVVKNRFSLSEECSLFIIAERDFNILAIFEHNQLLYGKYIRDVDQNEIIIEKTTQEIKEQGIVLDPLDTDIEKPEKFKHQSDSSFFDDEVSLDDDFYSSDNDFDLFDLDQNMENSTHSPLKKDDNKTEDDEFSAKLREIEDFVENELVEEELEAEKLKAELDINYQLILKAIKIGTKDFYGSSLYKSNFIQNCYILTNLRVENSFVQKIEDEFSFEVETLKVDLSELVIDLIGEELG